MINFNKRFTFCLTYEIFNLMVSKKKLTTLFALMPCLQALEIEALHNAMVDNMPFLQKVEDKINQIPNLNNATLIGLLAITGIVFGAINIFSLYKTCVICKKMLNKGKYVILIFVSISFFLADEDSKGALFGIATGIGLYVSALPMLGVIILTTGLLPNQEQFKIAILFNCVFLTIYLAMNILILFALILFIAVFVQIIWIHEDDEQHMKLWDELSKMQVQITNPITVATYCVILILLFAIAYPIYAIFTFLNALNKRVNLQNGKLVSTKTKPKSRWNKSINYIFQKYNDLHTPFCNIIRLIIIKILLACKK